MNYDFKKIAKAVIPVIIAVISIFVLSKYAASAEFHAKTIESLDDKKTTVMQLTAASTAASAAITLIPGDTATPIAEKLADLSSYFLLVLCAIYLEKYLLTTTGYVTFVILVPAACILYSVNVFLGNNAWKRLAQKLFVFGIAIFLVVPASVKVSGLIERTYRSSIEETIESARQTAEQIENGAEVEEEEDKGMLSGTISKIKNDLSNATTGAVSKLENVLNNFLEALAVMIVTACVIPIVVLLFFVWLVKAVLGANVKQQR